MIGMHRRISGAITMLTLVALVLTGCTSEASNIGRAEEKNGEVDVVDTGFTLSTVGSFDSADTAVVLATDPDNKAVSLINMDTGKQYTLYYDGTTYVKDKYDGPMSISQIKAGDVVDVTFLKGKKKLASIKRSPEAWVLDDVYNYDLAGANKTASIGSQIYSLPDSAVVLSEGRRVEAGEVVSQDVVTISGIDHKIYSVNVDKGHGYLRLKNDQPLLGGWIEVGNSVIRQIKEDMLLTVPEGSYQVVLSNNNLGCVKDITVERDKEVVLDVSDLEVAEDAVGKILFTVEPEDAKVSVDGKPVDISKAVELKYGIHQIQAEASGYDTLTKHIQVGSEYATISFKLEESRKDDEKDIVSANSTAPEQTPWQDTLETSRENKPSVSDNTTSSLSENALGTSSNYKVYVDSPKNVEIYLDGNYVGISPVRFTKTVGRHEITLKKSGYKTKTYTIYLENTKRDETYSFSALEKEDSSDSSTKKSIPKDVISAVSALSGCKLTNGTDVDIAGDLAALRDSGKNIVREAAKEAVKEKLGETEADKYTFTVEEERLTDVTRPGDVDGKGVAAVTVYRAGYKSQVVSCYVVLVKKAEEEPSVSDNSTSSDYKVYVKFPEEVEVYLDDNYIGLSPTCFTKTAGRHEITLKKNGYKTKTYTINLENTEKDETYSFSELEKENSDNNNDKNNPGGGTETPPTNSTDPIPPTDPTDPTAPTDPTKPTNPTDPSNLGDSETGDNADGSQSGDKGDNDQGDETDNSVTSVTGGNGGDKGVADGSDTKNDGDKGDTSDGLTTETVTITQESHPIRKWFSSLFKK